MIKKTYSIFVLILLLMFISGCFHYVARYDGTYRGKIIDEATGEPIEGVVVLGTWYTEVPGLTGPRHNYYDATETLTAKNGEFKIEGKGLRLFSSLEPMRITIFKAGYTYYEAYWERMKEILKREDGKVIMRMKKLTMEQRRKALGPPSPPNEAPKEKIKLMMEEINKDRAEQGLGPIDVGR